MEEVLQEVGVSLMVVEKAILLVWDWIVGEIELHRISPDFIGLQKA